MTSISVDNEGSDILFVSVATKNYGLIKDLQWHPFAVLTLLVLTESRVLVYKLDENPYEPVSEVGLKDL